MKRHIIGLALLASWLLLISSLAIAQGDSQSIATTTQVPAGNWQAILLRNLPQGASLRIVLETDGSLGVFLIEAEEYDRMAEGGRPQLAATTQRQLDITLRVPVGADYYLVLDNRQGDEDREAAVAITGSRH
ncbi:hypothetical protein [Halomonas sp. H5]|uniref:hypothetical protein n=1 Tax=Halomonas sp. H5 TaxID=3423910 RepID=UPI003D36AE37